MPLPTFLSQMASGVSRRRPHEARHPLSENEISTVASDQVPSLQRLLSMPGGLDEASLDPGRIGQESRVLARLHSSRTLRRHRDRGIILMMGQTGHGKSKTVNRLVGQDIFKVREGSSGSTTKCVQRISVLPKDHTGATLSFDDTPGLMDTQHADRDKNAILMLRYWRKYYSSHDWPSPHPPSAIFPNIILLVASWESVQMDDNDLSNLTSAVGGGMRALCSSHLVDRKRENVIVAITKSMSPLTSDEYDNEQRQNGKIRRWKQDAAEKVAIIHSLQAKAFPHCRPWRVVFVENGAGTKHKDDSLLPNGQTSRQGLFDAMLDLLSARDETGMQDLVGLYALRLATGASKIRRQLKNLSEPEILCSMEPNEGIPAEERAVVRARVDEISSETSTSRSSKILVQMAKQFVGKTYNPVYNAYGQASVLSGRSVKFSKISSRHFEQIAHRHNVHSSQKARSAQLRADFRIRCMVDIDACASSSMMFSRMEAMSSRWYIATKRIATAKIGVNSPLLSSAMLHEISALPPWEGGTSEDVRQQYDNFFNKHGTHVVTGIVMGGVLRISSQDDFSFNEQTVTLALQAKAEGPVPASIFGNSRLATGKGKDEIELSSASNVTVVCEGGRNVADRISDNLKELFSCLRDSPTAIPRDWIQSRAEWMAALETDPAFCREDPETTYMWIFDCDGLDQSRKRDLQAASKLYLEEHGEMPSSHRASLSAGAPTLLPASARERDLDRVDAIITDGERSWMSRYGAVVGISLFAGLAILFAVGSPAAAAILDNLYAKNENRSRWRRELRDELPFRSRE